MNKIIGLDKVLLEQVSGSEKFMYRLTALSFLMVVLLSVVSNGYFGWMMTASWMGVFGMALLMGFIHFSILRIAVTTMISLPLVKSTTDIVAGNSWRNRLLTIKQWFSFAGIVRWVFVGCIAVSMAFPLVSLMNHSISEQLNDEKRIEVYQMALSQQGGERQMPVNLRVELLKANYPFHVFRYWMASGAYRTLIYLVIATVAIPFLMLMAIKRNKKFVYANKASELFIQSIQGDYAMTMEESQWWLSKHYPWYKKSLQSLNPYEDAPFNAVLKNRRTRDWGNEVSWEEWKKGLA